MKLSFTVLPAFVALVSAQRIYNTTSAFAPGQVDKYKCLTTEKWLSDFEIPECLHDCTRLANQNDGCAFDDFVCHNINYQVYADIIEPCAFPPAIGGNGTCTTDELQGARPKINDVGNFFNATLYTAYTEEDCGVELSILKTLEIVSTEGTVVNT